MGNGFKDIAGLLLIIAFFLIPLLAPMGFIIVGAVGWSVAYLLVAFNAVNFNPAAHVPYWVTAWEVSTIVITVIFLILLGFIRGPVGAAAMLAVWGPLFIMPYFMIALGVGQHHPKGWWGYKNDHYKERCFYDGSRYLCSYIPLPGKKLPSFLEDHSVGSGGKMLRVLPYGSRNI